MAALHTLSDDEIGCLLESWRPIGVSSHNIHNAIVAFVQPGTSRSSISSALAVIIRR